MEIERDSGRETVRETGRITRRYWEVDWEGNCERNSDEYWETWREKLGYLEKQPQRDKPWSMALHAPGEETHLSKANNETNQMQTHSHPTLATAVTHSPVGLAFSEANHLDSDLLLYLVPCQRGVTLEHTHSS